MQHPLLLWDRREQQHRPLAAGQGGQFGRCQEEAAGAGRSHLWQFHPHGPGAVRGAVVQLQAREAPVRDGSQGAHLLQLLQGHGPRHRLPREKPCSAPATLEQPLPVKTSDSHSKSRVKAEGSSGAQDTGQALSASTALELPQDWDKCVLHLVLLWIVLVSMNTRLTKSPWR